MRISKVVCGVKPVNHENIKMNEEKRNYLHLVPLASYFRTRVVEIGDS
jgi:hypothetical protein